ncbi:hypothetical protein IUY40_06610 [Flavobacterium sp. ALJ2]|uniref:hypothetical protein n=1 Tax=Flavobacterium sp. ALJ2 TaxID=2786960 RepID=UPI00189D08F8|nr:hypothetical protein [Flavobacterium sp. ALJ2]MBF7091206.1 hypothetical protein [Flavobacterium sp. ALJ2]
MAISHKRKRKIIFKEKLYLWYIIKDDDYEYHYLRIISEDKKLQLSYRINQISDCFIHPKIGVLKSENLEEGVYHFFPTIADEIISNHNVGAILNWYDNQEKTVKPIVFKLPKNPFESIEFKSGIVTHIENNFSKVNLKEDMLQVIYPKNYLLDVGWYGSMNSYIIYIIRNNDWENPVAKANKGLYDLQEAIISAINIIEKRINELE